MTILTLVAQKIYRLLTNWYLWNLGVFVPLTLVFAALWAHQAGWFHSESDDYSPEPPPQQSTQSPFVSPTSTLPTQTQHQKVLDQVGKVIYAFNQVRITITSYRADLFSGIATAGFIDKYLKMISTIESENEQLYGKSYMISGTEKITVTGSRATAYICMDTSQLKMVNTLTDEVVSVSMPRKSYYFELVKNPQTSKWEVSLFYPETTRKKYCESYSAN